MKRQPFRLGSVLRYYVLQKQRTEFELHKASHDLQKTDAAIVMLTEEIVAVATLLHGAAGAHLTTTGWIACYRNAETLDKRLSATRVQRQQQAEAVTKLEAQRKRWAVREETLLALRRAIDENNQAEAAKAHQVLLDESVLRRWLDQDANPALDS